MIETTRRKIESPQAYEAWRAYAEMGNGRTLEAVGRKLGKSATIVERWSARHNWRQRLIQWQLEEAERDNKAKERAALERARINEQRKERVAERAWEMAERLFEKASVMVNWPLQRTEQMGPDGNTLHIEPLEHWRFSDATRALESADALARLATGMPQKHTAVTGKDGEPLTIGTPTTAATVIVNVIRDERTDEARKLFGERPENLARQPASSPDSGAGVGLVG